MDSTPFVFRLFRVFPELLSLLLKLLQIFGTNGLGTLIRNFYILCVQSIVFLFLANFLILFVIPVLLGNHPNFICLRLVLIVKIF